MRGTEVVSGTGPGRAAYEAVLRAFPEEPWEAWETLPETSRTGWAAVEQDLTAGLRAELNTLAGIEEQALEYARQVDDYREEHATIVAERDEARGQLADVRRRIGNLATALEVSAGQTEPSKKSDIERQAARRIRDAVRPAPAASGTEGANS